MMHLFKKICSILLCMILCAALLPVSAAEEETVSVMNADTGRTIAVGETNSFVLVQDGDKTAFRAAQGGYLDLSGSEPALTDSPVYYELTQKEHNRFLIHLPGGYLYDTDKLVQPTATLGLTDMPTISAAWYLKSEAAKKPLKVLCIGASNTNGVNPDSNGPQVAYRARLSATLTNYFGNVCFVGNLVNRTMDADSDSLSRHSGYNGYVIEDVYNVDQHPGIAPLVPDMLKKYTPDIVILMIGTNDLAFGTMVDTAMMDRWQSLAETIEKSLPENGLLVAVTLPIFRSHIDRTERFNTKLQERAYKMAKDGAKVAFVDVYSEMRESDIASDGVHMNEAGYALVADMLGDALKLSYDEFGNKTQNVPYATDPYAEPEPEPAPEEAAGIPWYWFAGGGLICALLIAAVILIVKKKGK